MSLTSRRSYANRAPQLPLHTVERVRYRDRPDQIVVVDRVVVQAQILAALAGGPRMKWQLREQLHVPETIIYRELQTLRGRGQVKVVGKRLTDRAWALVDWQAPIVRDTPPVSVSQGRLPNPAPTTSWWTDPDLTREGFQQRALTGADASLRYR